MFCLGSECAPRGLACSVCLHCSRMVCVCVCAPFPPPSHAPLSYKPAGKIVFELWRAPLSICLCHSVCTQRTHPPPKPQSYTNALSLEGSSGLFIVALLPVYRTYQEMQEEERTRVGGRLFIPGLPPLRCLTFIIHPPPFPPSTPVCLACPKIDTHIYFIHPTRPRERTCDTKQDMSGLKAVMRVSPALAKVLGDNQMPRTEAVKRM
jgi:hypothetical protein